MNSYVIQTDRILWVKPSFYEAIKSCDLMVVSGGDILADYGEAAVKHYFFPIAVAKALKKPVYVFAQSISKYKSENLLKFAKYYLNKVDLITVRERLSYEYLIQLKIKAPFYLTADSAFLLERSSEERLEEILIAEGISLDSALNIGISVSNTLTKWGGADPDKFLKIMSAACNDIIRRYNANIIFVPHVVYPQDSPNDDRVVAEKIYYTIEKKESAFLIKGDYSCRDLKALIGKCDIFVGARTHATIASASQLIPTLALAYSTKAFGIMEDVLDMKKCTCEINQITFDELINKVAYLIENKQQIKQSMAPRLKAIRERSLLNGKLAEDLLGSHLQVSP